MNKEIKSIEKNQTWELVDLPKGNDAIGLNGSSKQSSIKMEAFRSTKPKLLQKTIHNNPMSISMKPLHLWFEWKQSELFLLWQPNWRWKYFTWM